jgi:S-adenosylmethionine:tRNA ribosyltransferase-isomerase
MNELYNFSLPDALIAQSPAHPRDHARLLVYRLNDEKIIDDYFYNINKYLVHQTTIVLNNSKVQTCRWLFDNAQTELFVLEKLDTHTLRAMVRPGKKFKINDRLLLTDWLAVEVVAIDHEGIRTLRLNVPHNDARLKNFEHIPLPPYIQQDDRLASEYQTVYAKPPGSLAAPTAGLHFTADLLKELRQSHAFAELTLHVGLGTFAKLRADNFTSNRLHEEQFLLDKKNAAILQTASHITAVGTTTLRCLESLAQNTATFAAQTGSTDIFIRPGYRFKVVDSLITNFHLPGTSLLLLVAAFLGDKKTMSEVDAAKELQKLYAHAIKHQYRFYSFGDAMLIV